MDEQQEQAIDKAQSAFTLATAVLACAKAYEESFDKEKAAAGQKVTEDGGIFDFNTCYKLTLADACKQTAGALNMPVYLLLRNSWNDALDWASYIAGKV